MGCKVGILGNGDDHTGRPGACYATDIHYSVRGGLTCILATELTREGIWEALKARRTYATTGERIYLSIHCETHHMGEEFITSRKPVLDVEVIGTGALYSIEVLRGAELLFSYPFFSANEYLLNRIRIAWSGALSKTHGREADWDGSLRIERGRFRSVSHFAFDNWRHGIKSRSEFAISWRSTTSGDLDGLILDVDGNENTRLVFESKPVTFAFELNQLKEGPIIRNAGGVDQKVEFSLLPAVSGPQRANFSFKDSQPREGLNPYYLRVVQEDGEMAWSSPLYVYYKP
jgi:hypothetical protein